jgi:AcrR family transcriptional regulator
MRFRDFPNGQSFRTAKFFNTNCSHHYLLIALSDFTIAPSDIRYAGCMPRWKPDAQHRLQAAALSLFAENGYDGTTIAQIAERAGLEKRSFFRYFPDKREVLFGGGEALSESLSQTITAQPPAVAAWGAAVAALVRSGEVLAVDRDLSRARREIIGRNGELREREVLKSAQLEQLVRTLLIERGTQPTEASVTARLALLVYEVAFDRWLDTSGPSFTQQIERAALEVLHSLPSPAVR